jgi:hypothetical protein
MWAHLRRDKPPLNVLLFGEPRVGKSSIINLILGRNIADTLPDTPCSMFKHSPYEVNLRGRDFRLWDISSIALMNFVRRFFARGRLKKSYMRLHKGSGVHLLLYCMRGPSIPNALPRDYKYFTSIVGSTNAVPIAAVVNGLEGSLNTMDDWWTNNYQGLERVGMHFSQHACITSLSDDRSTSRSRDVIHSLICGRQTQ